MAILTVELPPVNPSASFTADNCRACIEDIRKANSPFPPVFRGAWMSHNILTIEILHQLGAASTQALVVVNAETGERIMLEIA